MMKKSVNNIVDADRVEKKLPKFTRINFRILNFEHLFNLTLT